MQAGDSLGLAVAVQEDVVPLHLHRRQVAVLYALADGVFVYRLPEVFDVVGGDLPVLLCFRRVLRVLELPGCGGQPDLYGVRIAFQDFRPFAPGGAMGFIDNDVAEVVLRVMGRKERCVAFLRVYPQGLVGRHNYPGVQLGVGRAGRGGVGAEHRLQRAQPLAPQPRPGRR